MNAISDIQPMRITSDERQYRIDMGWVLRGRHLYNFRFKLYSAGWVWDNGLGAMLAPNAEEYAEWSPPEVVPGEPIVRFGGRYLGWPYRAVPTTYLRWMGTLADTARHAVGVSDEERSMARSEVRRRAAAAVQEREAAARQASAAADQGSRAAEVERQADLDRRWVALAPAERADIERVVRLRQPGLRQDGMMYMSACRTEMERRASEHMTPGGGHRGHECA